MTVNPRLAFESLFGTSPRNRSVLDAAADDAVNLKARLGPGDRRRVEQQLEEIRGIEKRIEEIEKHNATVLNRALPSAPLGVPDSWEQHVKLMFDLQRLSFASDVTRVSAFKMSRDTSNRIFAESGVKAPFHTLSHHGESPEKIADFAKINRYHVGVVADFLRQLRDTPDGDGNLLDHSLILYGSPMGNSNAHNHRKLPVFLAGHAGGKVKGNLHVACADGTPHANTLLTILHKLGMDVESVGDSTGEIAI